MTGRPELEDLTFTSFHSPDEVHQKERRVCGRLAGVEAQYAADGSSVAGNAGSSKGLRPRRGHNVMAYTVNVVECKGLWQKEGKVNPNRTQAKHHQTVRLLSFFKFDAIQCYAVFILYY